MIWKLTLSITKRLLELQCAVADKKQNWRTARTHSFDVSISFNFNMLCNGKFIITCLNSFFISGPSTGLSNNCSSSTQFLNLFPFIYNHNYRTIWLFCPTSLNQFKVLILNAERKLCCYCLVMPQCMHEPPNDDFTILRGLAAQSKCDIGISPSGQKMGHWDLSQSHVQEVSGIVPNHCELNLWDKSQNFIIFDSGINPRTNKTKI